MQVSIPGVSDKYETDLVGSSDMTSAFIKG